MSVLYPEIKPYEKGLLAVGDEQQIYWEAYGNPDGLPALYLHGGPGSGSTPASARYFNPERYRIVLFDQRNCGKSLPSAADLKTDLTRNTTWDLVDDIEKLRQHLGIESWLLFGTSWGSTLALTYAQARPERVSAIVLGGVTMTRPSEIAWLTHGMAALFPEEWNRLLSALPDKLRPEGLLEGYLTLLNAPDMDTRLKAARDWHDWEAASILLADPNGLPRRWSSPAYLLTRARIIVHYFAHNAWLDDGALLSGVDKLRGIPGVLVQGRLDLEAPLTTAWELARAWPGSQLVIAEKAAHSVANQDIARAIVSATDIFSETLQK